MLDLRGEGHFVSVSSNRPPVPPWQSRVEEIDGRAYKFIEATNGPIVYRGYCSDADFQAVIEFYAEHLPAGWSELDRRSSSLVRFEKRINGLDSTLTLDDRPLDGPCVFELVLEVPMA